MSLTLATIDSSFATRERAREVASRVTAWPVTVDVSGVFVSPSFLAELLTTLVQRGTVDVVGDEESSFNLHLATKLIPQLGLSEAVCVQSLASA